MDLEIDKKKEFKNKIVNFYFNNKSKIYILLFIFLISIISLFLFKKNQNEKNNLVSEKYMQAGIYMQNNDNKNAIILLNDVILSKNNFYSILALNTILEKNLVTEKKKILNYFEIIEKLKIAEDKKDLILLKKALYLIKISDKKDGQDILKKIIEKNSKLKSIAEILIE